MARITYTATRNFEKSGFLKTGTDLSVVISDDSINAAGPTTLTGLLTDQWVFVAGFANAVNNGWFQAKADATSGKLLLLTPPITHLRLPGVSGNYASTPDSAANSIISDLTIVVDLILNDYTPSAIQSLVAKLGAAGHKSYVLSVNTDGTLNYSWSADGTAVISKNSTVATGLTDLSRAMLKVTHDVNNGAAGNDVKFWKSVNGGSTWTQIGTTVTTAGTTSIFNSDAILEVGSTTTGTAQLMVGRVFLASVGAGIDPVPSNIFNPALGLRNGSSIVASTGETWTINSTGTPPALLQGPVMVTEAAGPSVSLTGYKRGPGQSYNMDFMADVADPSSNFIRTKNQAIGGALEILLDREDFLFSVSVFSNASGAIDDTALKQWREFLSSVSAGEVFTFDAYGTFAAPVDPVSVTLVSDSYKADRIGGARYFKLSFDLMLA